MMPTLMNWTLDGYSFTENRYYTLSYSVVQTVQCECKLRDSTPILHLVGHSETNLSSLSVLITRTGVCRGQKISCTLSASSEWQITLQRIILYCSLRYISYILNIYLECRKINYTLISCLGFCLFLLCFHFRKNPVQDCPVRGLPKPPQEDSICAHVFIYTNSALYIYIYVICIQGSLDPSGYKPSAAAVRDFQQDNA